MKRSRYLLLLIACAHGAALGAPDDFAALLDEHWEWHAGELARVGLHDGRPALQRTWADRSLDAIEQTPGQTREFLRRLMPSIGMHCTETTSSTTSCFAASCRTTWTAPVQRIICCLSSPGGIQNLDNMTNRCASRPCRTTTTGSRARANSTTSSIRRSRWPRKVASRRRVRRQS